MHLFGHVVNRNKLSFCSGSVPVFVRTKIFGLVSVRSPGLTLKSITFFSSENIYDELLAICDNFLSTVAEF